MSSKNASTKDQQQTADQNLIAGLQKHASTIPSLLIAGNSVLTTSIIATLQARTTARTNTASARASYGQTLAAEAQEVTQSQSLVSSTKQAIKVMFAGQIAALADFGLTPPKPRTPLTPEQMVAAIAKGKATRAARHTMGPKAKAKITGATVAPVAAPQAADAPTVPVAASTTSAPVGASTVK